MKTDPLTHSVLSRLRALRDEFSREKSKLAPEALRRQPAGRLESGSGAEVGQVAVFQVAAAEV